MTTEELIQFASAARLPTGWQAGFVYYKDNKPIATFEPVISDELRRFAELVAANEREECAKVCEKLGMATNGIYERNHECAAAIRARTK